MKWEQIDDYHMRTRVVGGWLVKAYEDIHEKVNDMPMSSGYNWRVSMCFVPDANYEWNI